MKYECETGETASKYADYLRTSHWRTKRTHIFEIHNGICQQCKSILSLSGYEVHHLTYDNVGHELDKDLMLVCTPCHKVIHKVVPKPPLKTQKIQALSKKLNCLTIEQIDSVAKFAEKLRLSNSCAKQPKAKAKAKPKFKRIPKAK